MVDAFSFCLYGPERAKYHTGLLENIVLIGQYFPDWKVFVYLGSDITPEYIRKLVSYPNVILRHTNVLGHTNTIHRFFAIDEPGVETMMVRDADSRVHWKDRWAIHDFMSKDRGVHIIRDHRQHDIQILAGLWGIRKHVLPTPIQQLYREWIPVFAGSGKHNDPTGFGIDQNFLYTAIFPKISSTTLVHYSNRCLFPGETAVEFPFEWSDDIYCGRVELGDSIPREQPMMLSKGEPRGTFLNFLHTR